jgi:malonate decarboxylase beta subunit
METLRFRHRVNQRAAGSRAMAIVGVVASGNLEVLVERILPDTDCELEIKTAAEGFGAVWEQVVADFVASRSPGGLKLSVNDGGAPPDTVGLRLAQAVRLIEELDLMSAAPIAKRATVDEQRKAVSWYEASARERVRLMLDVRTFQEYIGPDKREISPHLHIFDLPEQFDDGMIVGKGLLKGQQVFVAAQEGRFMGGAFGEVHGAKLTGLLRAVREVKSIPLLIFFDTGGVRLQEANAGELAIAEIMRALIEARTAGAKVIGLIGGRAGCYGGGGLIAGCCSALAISEQGRIGVSGPEVIETNRGVEEFDSKDRALVGRTMGGKHRQLIGGTDMFVEDTIESFRVAAIRLCRCASIFDIAVLESEQMRLKRRLRLLRSCTDAVDVWRSLGVENPDSVPGMAADEFIALVNTIRESRDEAR